MNDSIYQSFQIVISLSFYKVGITPKSFPYPLGETSSLAERVCLVSISRPFKKTPSSLKNHGNSKKVLMTALYPTIVRAIHDEVLRATLFLFPSLDKTDWLIATY